MGKSMYAMGGVTNIRVRTMGGRSQASANLVRMY